LHCFAKDGRLVVSIDPRQRVELTDDDGHTQALLQLLAEGSRDVDGLVAALADRQPAITADEVERALSTLDDLGWLENAATAKPVLTDRQRERYFSNLAFFDGFTSLDRSREEIQDQLLSAHVLVLGVCGLGSAVVQHLVGLGVRRLTLVDFDTVDVRNFARQFTYTPDQIGQPKVDHVAAWVRAFDPAVEVTAVNRLVTGPEMITELLGGIDVVVSAIDQPDDIDLQVNRACVAAGVPFIRGGLAYLQGLYWSVDPGRSACRQCLEIFRDRQVETGHRAAETLDWPQLLRQERVNRAIGPVAGMLGALVAMEALRYLTGIMPPVAAGTYQLIDFTGDCRITTEAWAKVADCPVCAGAPERP